MSRYVELEKSRIRFPKYRCVACGGAAGVSSRTLVEKTEVKQFEAIFVSASRVHETRLVVPACPRCCNRRALAPWLLWCPIALAVVGAPILFADWFVADPIRMMIGMVGGMVPLAAFFATDLASVFDGFFLGVSISSVELETGTVTLRVRDAQLAGQLLEAGADRAFTGM